MKHKKIIFFIACLLTLGTAMAQENSLGLRFERNSCTLGYQHTFGQNWAIEADVAASGIFHSGDINGALSLTGLGQYRKTIYGPLSLVVGLGPSFNYLISRGDVFGDHSSFSMGIVGQVGIEYKFRKLPLALCLDIRPQYNFNFQGQGAPSCPVGLGLRFGFPKTHKDVQSPDMQAFLL